MKVQLNNSSFIEDLVESLRQCGRIVNRTGQRMLDVDLEARLPDEAARPELDPYLHVWEVKHPGSGLPEPTEIGKAPALRAMELPFHAGVLAGSAPGMPTLLDNGMGWAHS